uniref:Uncharacterized protein n=1 Tax=Apteryx owenii TaxID=8824 RepID=A0A8B9S5Z4_APTOW
MLSLKLPRLLSSNQVPEVSEQGILFGYRHPRSSATDCLLSVFQMTNETLNIWTHFVPTWYVTCSAFLIQRCAFKRSQICRGRWRGFCRGSLQRQEGRRAEEKGLVPGESAWE